VSDIAQNTDYLGEARGRLLEQFKNLPRIDGVLVALMAEVQQLEDAMYEVLVDRLLQNYEATGDMLDKLGAIVGEPRQGFDDATYSVLIGARIKANRSDGKHETLIDLTTLLVPTAEQIKFREYLKAVEIEANDVQVNPLVIWRDFLNRAKAAGTSLRFFFGLRPNEETLTRTSVYGGVTTVTGQRKGSVYGGGGTGVFAGVFGNG
jgi:hypothetical protein